MSTPHTIDFEEAVSGVTYQFVTAAGLVGSPVAVAAPFVDYAYLALADDPPGALGIRWAWTRTADGLSYTQRDLFDLRFTAQLSAIQAKTDTIASIITVLSPVSQTGNVITVRAGDSWSLAFTGLGDITGAKKLWLAVKNSASDADASSLIFLEKTDGLVTLNSSPAAVSANGTLTVSDATAGNIAATVDEAATISVPSGGKEWALKVVRADDSVATLAAGAFLVSPAFIRATA